MDQEELEAAIDCGFIPGVTDYDELTDKVLLNYFESKISEDRKNVSVDVVDKIIKKKLRMDMNTRSERSRMEELFITYAKILLRNGLKWIIY